MIIASDKRRSPVDPERNTGNLVRANIVEGNGRNGIRAAAGATGNTFEANQMLGNGTIAGFDAADEAFETNLNTWVANVCETDFPAQPSAESYATKYTLNIELVERIRPDMGPAFLRQFESGGGYVWAPSSGKGGTAPKKHWSVLAGMQVGDLIPSSLREGGRRRRSDSRCHVSERTQELETGAILVAECRYV